MKLSAAIQKRIVQLKEEKSYTAYTLSLRSGICQPTLCNILNNKTKDIKLSTLYAICEGLDITLEKFFESEVFSSENIEE